MFRHATARILSRSTAATRAIARPFSTGLEAGAPTDDAFMEAWNTVIPNIDPPKIDVAFIKPLPPTPSAFPSKVTVNFPYSSELASKEVDMVIVPATTGQMCILPGHVPTIKELKPGLMSVHEGNDVKKYFVSSGHAFIRANTFANIVVVEVVPLNQIDSSKVQKGLAEFTQKLRSASTDLEKAEAQIGVDVHIALNSALAG